MMRKSQQARSSERQEREQLDREYLQLREVICNTEFYCGTTRHNRIRLNLWSGRLDQLISDTSWKRNRNNYIKLMYLMAESEVMVEPFTNLPPETELPPLRNYQINAIIDMVESRVNQKIAKFGYCRQCKADEEQRTLPFHLSTNRHAGMELEEEALAQGVPYCNHPCLHPKQEGRRGEMFRYDSKTTMEGLSSEESNLDDGNQKENKSGNQICAKPMKEGSKQMGRKSLRQISLNNGGLADLEQNIRVSTIKVFKHLTMKQGR